MRWNTHTKHMCAKAYSKLWMLRNLKRFGANTVDLVDIYRTQCRSVLEMAVPAWSAGLTISCSNQIERVQKTALAIILGENYVSYENALKTLKLDKLSDRREKLCITFAVKSYKSDKFKKWFYSNANGDGLK